MPEKNRSLPVSQKEKVVFVIAVVQVGFALWGMGLIHQWAQFAFLGLSVFGLAVSLWPQKQGRVFKELDPGQSSTEAFKRLLKFPLIWLSLPILAYILIQGLNVAYAYEALDGNWRAYPVPHIEWLPSSVGGPYDKINPFRILVMFLGVGLFVTYLHIGLLRRRLWVALGWSVAIQAVAFSVLAFAQIKTNAELIYWTFDDQSPGVNFLGSIPYYNRGAAVVYLMMGSCMALYFYHLRNLRRRMLKSGPHLLLLPIIFVLYGTLWLSSSRAGITLCTAMVGLFVIWVIVETFVSTEAHFLRWIAVVFSITLVAAGSYVFKHLPNLDKTLKDFAGLETVVENIEQNNRYTTSKATWDLFKSRKWTGWGAGSWRYVFAYYQLRHPELQYAGKTRVVRDNPNNDWFQYLSELGIVGAALMLPLILYPFLWIMLKIRRVRMTHIVLVGTLLALVAHGFVETLMQNMTVLAFSGLVFAMMLKMPLRNARRSARDGDGR